MTILNDRYDNNFGIKFNYKISRSIIKNQINIKIIFFNQLNCMKLLIDVALKKLFKIYSLVYVVFILKKI